MDYRIAVLKMLNNSGACAQTVAIATKHAKSTFLCSKTLVGMQSSPDFDACDGLRTHI